MLGKVLGKLLQPRSQAPVTGSARRFVLVLMRPSIGRHLEVFREVIDVVAAGLSELGYESSVKVNEFVSGADHIVFCPRLLRVEDVDTVPASTILYNFEPLSVPVFDARRAFLSHYAPRFRVWDYSAANVEYLNALGCSARHVPLGYAAPLTRIAPARLQDIDVLFYGEITARRAHILDGLRATGLKVAAVSDIYGAERDALIARTKVVLNVHNSDAIRALESPRVVYLLANRKAVVTERKADVEIDADLVAAMAGAPYEGLVDACIGLVRDAARRAALEEAGFRCIRTRDEARILAAALDAQR